VKRRVSTAAAGVWYAAGATSSMKRFVLGRLKTSSVLCHSRSSRSAATCCGSRGSSAALSRSHTSEKSVGMNGLGAGSLSAGSGAAARHLASVAAASGARR
jgi:hypothetical protein